MSQNHGQMGNRRQLLAVPIVYVEKSPQDFIVLPWSQILTRCDVITAKSVGLRSGGDVNQ